MANTKFKNNNNYYYFISVHFCSVHFVVYMRVTQEPNDRSWTSIQKSNWWWYHKGNHKITRTI